MKALALAATVLALSAAPSADVEDAPWIVDIEKPIYFAVWVEDVDRSVQWYRDVFGLEAIGGSSADDGVWRIENLRGDDLFVEIVRDDNAEAVEFARGFGKVGFFVPDLDVVADRVEEATGKRPRVLGFERFGLRLLQLRDPDGNIVQVHARQE